MFSKLFQFQKSFLIGGLSLSGKISSLFLDLMQSNRSIWLRNFGINVNQVPELIPYAKPIDDIILDFSIPKEDQQPFYLAYQSIEDLSNLLDFYKNSIDESQKQIDLLANTYQFNEEQVKLTNSLKQPLNRAIEHINRRQDQLRASLAQEHISQHVNLLYKFFRKNIDDNLIKIIYNLYSHLYDQEEKNKSICFEVICIINQLLKKLGIYTVERFPNNEFDYHCFDAIPLDDDSNITQDKSLRNRFKHIEQYAYTFDGLDFKICNGKAVGWIYQKTL